MFLIRHNLKKDPWIVTTTNNTRSDLPHTYPGFKFESTTWKAEGLAFATSAPVSPQRGIYGGTGMLLGDGTREGIPCWVCRVLDGNEEAILGRGEGLWLSC